MDLLNPAIAKHGGSPASFQKDAADVCVPISRASQNLGTIQAYPDFGTYCGNLTAHLL
jgi:hypothetical protein